MTTHSDTPYPQPPTNAHFDKTCQKEIFDELREKEGVTSRQYARMVARLLIHKIENGTATTCMSYYGLCE